VRIRPLVTTAAIQMSVEEIMLAVQRLHVALAKMPANWRWLPSSAMREELADVYTMVTEAETHFRMNGPEG
jgi:hypothetical protein